jgi:hypothetical protein
MATTYFMNSSAGRSLSGTIFDILRRFAAGSSEVDERSVRLDIVL